MKKKRRYTVLKMVSGYTGIAKYYVYDLRKKARVTVHAHLQRSAAEEEAKSLNIDEMVRPHAEDPRPYAVRLAAAWVAYHADESSAGKPLIKIL